MYVTVRSWKSSITNLMGTEWLELSALYLKKIKKKKKKTPKLLYLTLFTQSLSSANIDQSAPNLVKIFISNRFWMNSIMGPIAPEQLELLALELGKIATFDFFYSVASTNISQSAPNLVTMNMSIDLRWVWLWVKSYQIGECCLPLK